MNPIKPIKHIIYVEINTQIQFENVIFTEIFTKMIILNFFLNIKNPNFFLTLMVFNKCGRAKNKMKKVDL